MAEKLTDQRFNDISDGDFIDIEGTAEDISDIQKDVDAQMDRIFEEFGGDDRDTEFKINVKRAIPDKGVTEHCFSCTPAELPIIDRIQEQYGPGVYQIWIYKDGKIFKRRNLHIAKPVKSAYTPPHLQGNNSDIPDVVRVMLENQQRQMEQFQEIISRNQNPIQHPIAPAFNPMEMMGGMMGMMVQMKEFMGGNNQGNGIDTLLKGMEIMKDFQGSDKETNILDVAKEFLPNILDVTKTLSQNQGTFQSSPSLGPQISGDGKTQPNINPESRINGEGNENMNPRMIMIKTQLNNLVNKASQNADPVLYADFIIDNVPEDQIRSFLGQPDSLDQLARIDPRVNQFLPWFTNLKMEIMTVLDVEEYSDDTPTNEDGKSPESDTTPPAKGDAAGDT